ncbi:MAG: ATP-binding protein, partial [Parafilimonas sp.]
IQLNQNNVELEQIAFAASHDLQEPLRKIRIFSDRLRMLNKNNLQNESAVIVEKINRSAAQLHGLILDLVELTNIVQAKQSFTTVFLDNIISEVEKEFQQSEMPKIYKLIKAELPAVYGSSDQLQKLFTHLFSNSFAFQSSERSLAIIISVQKIKSTAIKNLPAQSSWKEYYHIKFQDNGIGFNPAFKEKLFMPFQRLHNYGSDDLKRKGMGLAICKRIMVNHNGWIDGDGSETKGAEIHLYFPADILQ